MEKKKSVKSKNPRKSVVQTNSTDKKIRTTD
jgi:hypothetical protein